MRILKPQYAMLLLVLLAPATMRAQTLATASIRGTVTDPSGAAVVGAEITLQNTASDESQKQQTSNVGQYTFSNVAPGAYKITATMHGFRQAVVPSVQVFAGFSYVVNFKLEVGPLHEVVEVRPTVAKSPRVAERAERADTATIITAEDISEKHASTLNDVIDMTPGMAVARRSRIGWAGPGAGFRIRGITNAELIVFEDDIPIMGYNHGHPIPDEHSVDNIDRIEIVHGPSPVLYGANAMGGLINITTIEPATGWSGMLESLGGTFHTTETTARGGYGWSRGYGILNGNFRHTDGHRPKAGFDAGNVNFKISEKLSDQFALSFRGAYDRYIFENPGPVGGTPGRTRQFSGPLGNITLRGRFARSETLVAFFADQVEFKHTEAPFPPVFRDTEWGGRVKESLFLFKGNTLIIGLDAVSFGGTWQNSVSELVQEERTALASPYVFVEQVLNRVVTVNGGFRVTASNQFGTDVAPEGGIVFHPIQTTAFRFRAAKGFRVPRDRDIAFAKGVAANPNLQPEWLIQYEFGVNQKVGRWVTVDVAGFYQNGDNLIQSIPVSPGVVQNQNTGVFIHKGIEATAIVRPRWNLSFNGGVTILNLGKDTATVPLHTYDFGADYFFGRFTFSLSGRYASQLFGGNNKTQKLPIYLVIDHKTRVRLWEGLRAFVEVDNLTNRTYQEIPGFPQPGITAFGGLSYRFGTFGNHR